MTPIRRAAIATVALTATLGLSACNNETVTSPPSADSTAGAATSAGTTSDAPSSADGHTGSDAADESADTETQGKTTTGSVKDKNAIPVERATLPSGPVTNIDVKLLGGYSTSSDYGEFYAVLDVTSSERGLVDLEYTMLDKSGNALKTVKDSIAVGGADHEMKVTRASGELPSEGKADKVRLKVVKNKANSFATVTQIKTSSLQIGHDSSTDTPTVSGQYRTDGKGSVISMNAICVDDKGVVRSDSSPVDKIKAPTWTPFTVKMLMVKPGYNPTSCFVGS